MMDMNSLKEQVFARVDEIDPTINYVVFIDFETYYDNEYSLRNLTTYEYVNHPKFDPFFASVCYFSRISTAKEGILKPEYVRRLMDLLDHEKTLFVSHNAAFDAQVLHRLYPKKLRWWCTMQAAHQTLLPRLGSVSLASLATYYGLPVDKSTIVKMQGRRLSDLPTYIATEFKRYAEQDVRLCVELFTRCSLLGADEPKFLMWTITSAVYPRLMLDMELLEQTIADEERVLEEGFRKLDILPTHVRSSQTFVKLLETLGVEVVYKQGARGPVPAVAKTDQFMQELLEHPNPEVARLAEYRLVVTSTIKRTRAARMLAVGRSLGGSLPVPLHYHRARTGRWTGAEKLNLQNLSRGAGPLRRAIMARPGRALVVVDAAQIEARIVAALAGAHDLVDAFARGRDVYSEFATRLYGHTVTKKDHPMKRQVGKLAVLSLGYGCGAEKFHWIARVSGGIVLEQGEAERVVETYRSTWPEIPRLWRLLDRYLVNMLHTDQLTIDLHTVGGPVALHWEAPYLFLPTGRPIVFAGLEYDPENDRIVSLHAQHGKLIKRPIWGGHVTENIVQAMARDVLCKTHLKFIDHVVLQVHDELVLEVSQDEANDALNECIRSLSQPVSWLPDCVLSAEGAVAERYGDAKS